MTTLLGNLTTLPVTRGAELVVDEATGEVVASGSHHNGPLTEITGYLHEMKGKELLELADSFRDRAKYELYCGPREPRLFEGDQARSSAADSVTFVRDGVSAELTVMSATHWEGTQLDHSCYVLGYPLSGGEQV